MFNPFDPPPAPPAFGKGKILPEKQASWPSRIIFHWLGPFLAVGYSRPIQPDDLWELPPNKRTAHLTELVQNIFYVRCPPDKRPNFFREDHGGDQGSGISSNGDATDEEKPNIKPKATKAPKYDSSLFKSLHSAFFYRWWIAGIFYLGADTLRTTTPLVIKVLLNWLTESYIYHHLPDEVKAAAAVSQPRGIGFGIGLAFALFAMQQMASLLNNHFFIITMVNGLCVRSALIGNIFQKSLRLSGRARISHSVGQITTMISTDATRLDRFSMYVHALWVSPIQIILGIGLLLGNLGYSALVGLGVLILGLPIQTVLVMIMFKQRKKGVKFTDTRLRLTTEVLQGVRLLKVYGWEKFYIHQLELLRKKEIQALKKTAIARAGIIALMSFVPVLAAVLSFITYSLSGHELNIAVIFSSLQLFNVIRMPLATLPIVFSFLSDALVALSRISSFLLAEELPEPYQINYNNKRAITVDADFAWETAAKLEDKFNVHSKKHKHRKEAKDEKSILPTKAAEAEGSVESHEAKEQPFVLKNLSLEIDKGSFVAIVGRVGSGKSSLLQALIGEMRKTRGEVNFGGSVSYVPQRAWIQNATLRENILFGHAMDESRFRQVIKACSLEHDIAVLPQGEETEIGEKGINLSGGQKARVSLARAAYSDTDIVLLDDPLSAVDAYVGKDILDNCLLRGPLADRTRVLVTHALHVLDKVDYIYVVNDGVLAEQGTYEALMKDSVSFGRLIEEFGSIEDKEDGQPRRETPEFNLRVEKGAAAGETKNAALMQTEERNVGAVTWDTYTKYLRFGGGIFWAPFLFSLLVLNQAAAVGNNLFLGFWTGQTIPGFTQGSYMGVYASLGVANALFSFLLGMSFSFAALIAGFNLFRAALKAVLHSPTSFFDTTPMGRILSRLSKDQDTLDTELSMTLYQFLNTFSSILGTAGLVFYTFPYLGIMFAPMAILYYGISVYYRRTSVETKRLDSLMRSALYSSYSETLTGLSTIRAYRTQDTAVTHAHEGLDMENRAYYMTVSIQRWLALRLDVFGNVLVFGIALFAAGFRETVNPARIGVVLTYTLSITQVFSEMVNQFAQNEQNMNAVERILVYTELPPEGDLTTPKDPPQSWPEKGEIEFSNVEFAYREGLPLVLKDISFKVRAGEKIGIVGRTGSGKSSLLQALFRTVELRGGKIEIDGQNIGTIGLSVLRRKLALVPQDSTLFLGTLRENLDPEASRTDAELITVLQRAWLLPRDGHSDPNAEAKFSLESTIGDEGSNYSVGERQLLALCRALVKNSKIIVLDEATSSVDVETDSKLQQTIQTEFGTSTLLCIAHRLNTIAYYDRVLVMDNGKVAEFDTVLNLFDKEDSIFRSLCNEASLSRQDIVRIRSDSGFSSNQDLNTRT
ncbi:multidrug resistance-associated ABC transporter [Pleurotus eryngii]|uniref:Multidrug resistance-associated ABC transporter n=1 Tax=Pleurotus eryngii TaxID=5323 RepID=A0A9P6A9K8_PLEER|nr:multidrug resistance-associated ABC transporter [Pleurotus eryngii]